MSLISKDMRIADVIQKYPRTEQVFVKYAMNCAGCMGSVGETIEGGARMHSIDLAHLLEDLNRVIAESPNSQIPQ